MDGAMETVAESWKVDPTYNKISDFLGLDIYDRQNYKTYQKIEKIKEYAQQKGEHPTQILNEMYRLKKSLGTWRVGEDLVNELFQNVRIKEATNKFNAEKKIVEKKDNVAKEVVKPNKETGTSKSLNGMIQKSVAQAVQSKVSQHISNTVNQGVKQTLSAMIRKTLSDKKTIQKTTEEAITKAIGGITL